MPQIEVTFDIDANGILHVSAKDKATGKENKIKIKASSGLTEDEIQRMVKDAEAHAEDDRKQLELVHARNQLDALVHTVKKSLAEYGDKVDADEKAKIEAALKDAEELLKQQGRGEGRDRSEDRGARARPRRSWARRCTPRRRRKRAGRGGGGGRRGGGDGGKKRRERRRCRVHGSQGQEVMMSVARRMRARRRDGMLAELKPAPARRRVRGPAASR